MGTSETRSDLSSIACVDADAFKQGMRRFAGACNVIATVGEAGWIGVTATAVMSVTAEPARLLVCINRSAFAYNAIAQSGVLSVNVLGADQEDMAKLFAGMCPDVAPNDRFQKGSWRQGLTGAPMLETSLVSFDCQVVETIVGSSHDMFLCSVVGVAAREGSALPLIYFDGKFGSFC